MTGATDGGVAAHAPDGPRAAAAQPRPARASAGGAPLRVAVVGVSLGATCGVRDHARLLAGALAQEGVSCSWHWHQREARSLRAERAEMRRWRAALAAELAAERPDAVLVHYSVFAYSHKGVPLFVRRTFATLRNAGVPVVVVLHEFAYPWRLGGWRGTLWAVSQRALLVTVLRAASAAIVTADSRVSWLHTRRWLPRREVVLAPVYSNLPAPGVATPRDPSLRRVGLFGYSYQGAAVTLVLDALAELSGAGAGVQLRLLGAPGASSEAGRAWIAAADERGLAGALSFSGPLPAQELSDELAACEVLLFADVAGPSSRKGTLAGSLASGRPVVAIDGPMAWSALREARAIRVAEPAPSALAAAIAELLADAGALEQLGARGRAFYEREMALERTARATHELLSERVNAS
jgi:glycosyltransferase involved in cell wall biosynthesis